MLATTMTNMTPIDMPTAVSILFETPKNGHNPKNLESKKLFTSIAAKRIAKSLAASIQITPYSF